MFPLPPSVPLTCLRLVVHNEHFPVEHPELAADVIVVSCDGVASSSLFDDAHGMGVAVGWGCDGSLQHGIGVEVAEDEIGGPGVFLHVSDDAGVFLCIEFSNPEPCSVGVGLTAECGAIMESHMVVLHGYVDLSVFDASFNIFHGEGFSSVSKDHAIETGSGSVFSVWMDVDVSGEGVPVGPCRSFLCAEICPFSSCIQVECPFSSNGG